MFSVDHTHSQWHIQTQLLSLSIHTSMEAPSVLLDPFTDLFLCDCSELHHCTSSCHPQGISHLPSPLSRLDAVTRGSSEISASRPAVSSPFDCIIPQHWYLHSIDEHLAHEVQVACLGASKSEGPAFYYSKQAIKGQST